MLKKNISRLLIVAFTFLLVGCGGSGDNGSEAKNDTNSSATSTNTSTNPDTLTIAISGDMGTLDPGVSMDNFSWKITYPTYERLVEFDGESTEVKPGLASSWETSDDGLKWTFHLEKDHKFEDGTEVNADAVKFTFDRTIGLGKGPADTYKIIKEVNVVDDYTIEFVLNNAFSPFLSTLATNYGGIINPAVMKEEVNGDKAQGYLSNHTAGSGAYTLAEWKKGEYLKLGLNPNSGKSPKLKEVYFKLVADPSESRLQLEKGDIDIAEGIEISQLAELKDKDNISIVQKPGLFVDYLYLNTSKGNASLQNKDVRQAINYAIDYKSIIDQVMSGYASEMKGPIPNGLWGHDDSVFQYTYDVDKAKSLLQSSGQTNLELNLLYSDRYTNWEQEALIIQANLADIGITVNLNKVAYATMRDMLDSGDFDLALGAWSPDYADPSMFMNYWFDSNNFGLAGNRAFYSNPEVDELVRKATTINDNKERESIYKKTQDIVVEDAPYAYFYQKDFVLPMNKSVQGFIYNPMLEGIYNLEDMSK